MVLSSRWFQRSAHQKPVNASHIHGKKISKFFFFFKSKVIFLAKGLAEAWTQTMG
jgi:hypothetical protein